MLNSNLPKNTLIKNIIKPGNSDFFSYNHFIHQTYLVANWAEGEGTLDTGGRDFRLQWSGTVPSVTGSSCKAPWHSWPAPWSDSQWCGGVAVNTCQILKLKTIHKGVSLPL